jgi:hypothetical protein
VLLVEVFRSMMTALALLVKLPLGLLGLLLVLVSLEKEFVPVSNQKHADHARA